MIFAYRHLLHLIFPVSLLIFAQCNFSSVQEAQPSFMYFKANNEERALYHISIYKGISGMDHFIHSNEVNYSCGININPLTAGSYHIPADSAYYSAPGHYYRQGGWGYSSGFEYRSLGQESDSLTFSIDSVKNICVGHFSFVAVSPIIRYYSDTTHTHTYRDTTWDTVRITNGVFVASTTQNSM
jgi:hypothetical protein